MSLSFLDPRPADLRIFDLSSCMERAVNETYVC